MALFATTTTDIVVLFSDVEDSTLRAVSIKADGTSQTLTVPKLSNKIAIDHLKCRAFKSSPDSPSCIITHNGNFVTDITVTYDSAGKAITFAGERQYFYFEDYLPVYIDFNEEFVIMKSRNAQKEAMMFYRRSSEVPNQLFWGLEPSEYYNKEGAMTNSIPLIYTTGEGQTAATNYRFTQNIAPTQMLSQTPQDPFTGMKMQDVELSIDGDVTKDAAAEVTILFNNGKTEGDKINILKIFKDPAPEPEPSSSSSEEPSSSSAEPEPEPEDDGVPWWVWVIIGMVVFLILVTLLLKFLTKTKDEEEEEDVYYGSEGKAKAKDEEEGE